MKKKELAEKDIYRVEIVVEMWLPIQQSLPKHAQRIYFGKKEYIKWKNNWVVFMDNMLQMKIISLDPRVWVFMLIEIRKLIIDPKDHQQYF